MNVQTGHGTRYEQVTAMCAAPYTRLNDCILEEIRRSAGGTCADDPALASYVSTTSCSEDLCVDATCRRGMLGVHAQVNGNEILYRLP